MMKAAITLSLIDSIPQEEKPWVRLVGENGNAYAILTRVRRAWKRKRRLDIADEYSDEAMSGDYAHLLMTSLKYINEKKDRYNETDDENAPEGEATQDLLEPYQHRILSFWEQMRADFSE